MVFAPSFGPGNHKGTSVEKTCSYPFDGEGGVLAHAFAPSDGRLHFDEAEQFTDRSHDGTNLLYVAVHEIGHNLGLRHSNVRDAIIYPTYLGYKENLKLHSDDIAGIQSLYGKMRCRIQFNSILFNLHEYYREGCVG